MNKWPNSRGFSFVIPRATIIASPRVPGRGPPNGNSLQPRFGAAVVVAERQFFYA